MKFGFGFITENFEVFENDIFDCKVLWMVGKGEWNSVGSPFYLNGLFDCIRLATNQKPVVLAERSL